MEFGMLWYDDDSRRSLDEKVARAAAHYQSKYGRMPTACFVHPTMLASGIEAAGGLRLFTSPTVMVNHFWVGMAEGAQPARKTGGKTGVMQAAVS